MFKSTAVYSHLDYLDYLKNRAKSGDMAVFELTLEMSV